MLLEQLNLHYFTPVIQKILDIKDEYGYAYFSCYDRPWECRFTINMGSNAVVRLKVTAVFSSLIWMKTGLRYGMYLLFRRRNKENWICSCRIESLR